MLPVYTSIEGHKPRLGRRFCFAAGAQLLSDRFAHVPQANNLQIWFNDHPMDHMGFPMAKMTMDQIVAESRPYQVFGLWYSTIGEPRWYFMVYPVERTRKSQVRQLLEESAFSTAEEWLSMRRNETWLQQSHHLRFIYHQVEGTVAPEEDAH